MVLLLILFIILSAAGPRIEKYATHFISKLIIVIGIILLYILAGMLLDTNTSKRYDFFSGFLITAIGIIIWVYTFLIFSGNLSEIAVLISEELSGYWILMNIYHTPFIFLRLILILPNMPIVSLIENLLLTVFIGFGLRYKRAKSVKS